VPILPASSAESSLVITDRAAPPPKAVQRAKREPTAPDKDMI